MGARTLALLGVIALASAAAADALEGGLSLAAASSGLATVVALALGAARAPVQDGWPDVELALARVLVALLALALGWRPGPLGFHEPGHAVAVFLRAAALVAASGSLALTLSTDGRARLARWLRERRAHRVLVRAAVLVAAILVARELVATWREPLPPDAQVFRSIAARAHEHPYDTGFREPVHVWLLWALDRAIGASDPAVRLSTVALHALSCFVFYRASRALFGRRFAAIALLLYAASTWSARMSVQGLRTEEVVIVVSLFVVASRRAVSAEGTARDALLAGVLSGLASLTYISLLVTTQAWLLLSWLHARGSLRRYPLAVLPAVLLIIPHLANNQRACGDPLYTVNMHAVFYRNVELLERPERARPGLPTRDEIARDRYAGPRTTALRWMFLEREPRDALAVLARGTARILTYRAPVFDAYRPAELGFVVWIVAVLGALAIVVRARERLWVLALALLGVGPVVFPLGVFVAIEPRLTNQFFFAWLWLLAGLIGERGRSRRGLA